MSHTARFAFVGLGTMGLDLLRQAVEQTKIDVVGLCASVHRRFGDREVYCAQRYNLYRQSNYARFVRSRRRGGRPYRNIFTLR